VLFGVAVAVAQIIGRREGRVVPFREAIWRTVRYAFVAFMALWSVVASIVLSQLVLNHDQVSWGDVGVTLLVFVLSLAGFYGMWLLINWMIKTSD
jgi:hypothetical protein